jgi:arylsulfatase A-like enzyme
VILVLTDDHGYGDLSLHGNDKLKTPNLDSIAKQGVQFTQFHVSPVCSPTRSSLMTGRYNYRTGVVDTYLGRAMMYPDEVTLAELLGGAGYGTGIFGKWHLGDNYPMRSIDQGFQESLVHRGGGIGQPSDPPGGESYFDPILQHNGKQEKHKGYCTDVFMNAALAFIEANRARPFFAYIATNAPHSPLQIDESYVAPCRALGLDEKTAKVYGMVANIDENVGRLLARLKALGLEQDTILIFMTDNGPAARRYNVGMRGIKGTVYEGGIRVPCFLRWPRVVQAGGQIDRLAAHIDILPTLLEAGGVDKPAGLRLDGASLMPLLRNHKAGWPDRTLYFQWHRGDEPELYRSCAARTQRFKLVNGKELYDLAADPGEQNDIAAGHPDIVAGLRKGCEEWFRDVSATRGYAPPRIHLGTKFENPVTLTRQDWRGPKAGWERGSLGYWEVEVTQTASYQVTLTTYPAEAAGEARFLLNNAVVKQPVAKGQTECQLASVPIQAGKGRLEAFLQFGEKTVGVRYVDVKRL